MPSRSVSLFLCSKSGTKGLSSEQRSGYLVISRLPYRIFNIALALLLIVAGSPIILILAIVLTLRCSGPLLYKGIRLGKDKRPFTMYKFRTLPKGTERMVGAELLTQKIIAEKNLLGGLNKWLRDTRLDEIPQLFNILKGDMNFMGPRPERPEVYEMICRHIPGYDRRFAVKPGLIGYSQLFTPYNTPKSIRAHIDNKFLRKGNRLPLELAIILKTIYAVMIRIIQFPPKLFGALAFKNGALHIGKDRRALERKSLDRAFISISRDDSSSDRKAFVRIGKIHDINEDALLTFTNEDSITEQTLVKLQVNIKSGKKSRGKIKSAICVVTVFSRKVLEQASSRFGYVLRYRPVSDLDYYIIHQYFLQRSIIKP